VIEFSEIELEGAIGGLFETVEWWTVSTTELWDLLTS